MPQSFDELSDGVIDRRRTLFPDAAETDRVGPSAVRAPEAEVLRLQQYAGNSAVSRMLQRQTTRPDVSRSGARGTALPVEESDDASCFVALPPQLEEGGAGPAVGDEAAQATVAPTPAASASSAPSASAPSGSGLAGPQAVSWAAVNAHEDEGAEAIPGPSIATLAAIQAAAGGSTGTVGWTSFPLATAKAPQFDFGSTSSTPGGTGPASWACTPTLTQHFYEGDSVCMYLAAARHPTALTEGGKPVFFNVNGAISARDGQAEAEHANDIKRARDISIKEAETVLNTHVIGQTFPAAGTKAAAEQKVLDKITSKLTHAGLGNDQTKWAAIYETLYRKTLTRDNNGWHTFALGGRTQNAAGDVDYTLTNGTTSINTTTSAALIVY